MSGGDYKDYRLGEEGTSSRLWNLLIEAQDRNAIFDCSFMVKYRFILKNFPKLKIKFQFSEEK